MKDIKSQINDINIELSKLARSDAALPNRVADLQNQVQQCAQTLSTLTAATANQATAMANALQGLSEVAARTQTAENSINSLNASVGVLQNGALDQAEIVYGKADKVVPAAAGNLAMLDENGNLQDSGKAANSVGLVGGQAEVVTNKIDAFDAHSTHQQYVSAKGLYDFFEKPFVENFVEPVGNELEEITALFDDVPYEKTFNNSDCRKVFCGSQKNAGPTARVFFRHNYQKARGPKIKLRFYFTGLQTSGLSVLPCAISLNGVQIFNDNISVLTGAHQAQVTCTPPKSLCAQVFNVIQIDFNSTALAEIVLDYVECEILYTNNCLILNRKQEADIYAVRRKNIDGFILFCSRYNNNNIWTYYFNDSFVKDSIVTYIPEGLRFVCGERIRDLKYIISHYISLSTNGFVRRTGYYSFYLITQNNNFYPWRNDKQHTQFVPNVLYAKQSVHNGLGNDSFSYACITKQDFSVALYDTFLCYEELPNNSNLSFWNNPNFMQQMPFLFKNEIYPNQFVDFIPVSDCRLDTKRPPLSNFECGYFLLHQTGIILFVPSANSNYFIKIGMGYQVRAFINENGTEITVCYLFNGKTVLKKLTRTNINNNNWTLQNEYSFNSDFDEYFVTYLLNFGLVNTHFVWE